ncbi:MAG: cell division protein FtsZ [Candidatus Cloacimonadota bacterium]|jgi:cell division protein FtsZ|nr:cell division protein FtsZ [Candidatus Cloacimonadota bacterium]
MLDLDLTADEVPIGTNIKVIGVGGAGGNAVNTMIENNLSGVEFIAANTDLINLKNSKSKIKLQLGKQTTKGLGTGANPEIGKKSAEESSEEIREYLENTDLLFIAAGMGGGTGTGASPVIAQIAKDMEILTVAIVNRPFSYEGRNRLHNAEKGIKELTELVDSIMVIPNDKIYEEYPSLTVKEAFNKANLILLDAAKGITEIINSSGHINVDFADVKTVMANRGLSMIGIGIGEGENRAAEAVEKAMNNPLLTDVELSNAKGILINITAGEDFRMSEFKEISQKIAEKTGDQGEFFVGLVNSDDMEDKIKITLIATGLNGEPSIDFESEMPDFPTVKDEEEELGEVAEKIKLADSMELDKKDEKKKNDKNNLQMEIPAFLRKFSN